MGVPPLSLAEVGLWHRVLTEYGGNEETQELSAPLYKWEPFPTSLSALLL